jgi:LytR cell envelope-related transcriptional attenuator
MKNVLILFFFTAFAGIALLKGTTLNEYKVDKPQNAAPAAVPYIGRIQILNGCGSSGAAHGVAEFLRSHHFDVKNIGNADSWSFTETLVISRIADTTIADQVAQTLSTKNSVLIRNQETRYDVTVIVGNDYRERIR